MKINIFKILVMIAVFAILQIPVSCVMAGITIAPDRHIVYLSPGEEETVKYQVYNSGGKDVDITIVPESWSGVKDPYSWLRLENDKAHIKAGQTGPVVVKVNAPEDNAGEMVAMLFLCYKDMDRSQLNIRSGVPLYLIIKGTEDYSLDIDDIGIAYAKNEDNANDINIMVKIKNTGNVHIVPDVKAFVKDSEGRTAKELFLAKPNIVLRDEAHIYRLGWRNPFLRDGIYTVIVELNYEDKIASVIKEARFKVSGNSIDMVKPAGEGR
jgi:hypothetical protein